MGKQKISFILKSIFSLALIVFLCANIETKQLEQITFEVTPYLLIGVAITLLALLIMAFRWKMLIKEFLNTTVPIKELYSYYLIGAFFNTLLPSSIGGDIVRTEQLHKQHALNLKVCTTITIVERMTGIYGLILLFTASIALGKYSDSFALNKYIPQWLLHSAPLFVLLLIPATKLILGLSKARTSYSFIIRTVLVLLLSQMGDILIAWSLSEYFNLHTDFGTFLFIMPLVYIATVLPISLGGLGVREGTFSGLMSLYGVDVSIAITISLFMYFIKLATGVIGYVAYIQNK